MARPRKATIALQGAMTKDEMNERLKIENALKGDNDKLVAPDFIRFDEVANKKFDELVSELDKVGIINNVDVDLIAVYCDTWSKYVKATKMMVTQDLVDEFDGSNKNVNPYIKIQQSYATQLVKISSLFGLSPVDRSKIAHLQPSDKTEKRDPLVELLSGLKKSS